jgi:hypothetical protein
VTAALAILCSTNPLSSIRFRTARSAHWLQQWSKAVPGSDPARASVLIAPIAAARQAVVYRSFLDNIEPSEHPYHRADPAKWLNRTAALVRKGDGRGDFVAEKKDAESG